jgi:hypothetical protein
MGNGKGCPPLIDDGLPPWYLVVTIQLHPVLVRMVIFQGMGPKLSMNLEGIWSMPKVDWKMV